MSCGKSQYPKYLKASLRFFDWSGYPFNIFKAWTRLQDVTQHAARPPESGFVGISRCQLWRRLCAALPCAPFRGSAGRCSGCLGTPRLHHSRKGFLCCTCKFSPNHSSMSENHLAVAVVWGIFPFERKEISVKLLCPYPKSFGMTVLIN